MNLRKVNNQLRIVKINRNHRPFSIMCHRQNRSIINQILQNKTIFRFERDSEAILFKAQVYAMNYVVRTTKILTKRYKMHNRKNFLKNKKRLQKRRNLNNVFMKRSININKKFKCFCLKLIKNLRFL